MNQLINSQLLCQLSYRGKRLQGKKMVPRDGLEPSTN